MPTTLAVDRSELPPPHLFTVRVWLEDVGGGKYEWRGRIQNLASGEVRFFREWPALATAIAEMVEPGLLRKPPLTSK